MSSGSFDDAATARQARTSGAMIRVAWQSVWKRIYAVSSPPDTTTSTRPVGLFGYPALNGLRPARSPTTRDHQAVRQRPARAPGTPRVPDPCARSERRKGSRDPTHPKGRQLQRTIHAEAGAAEIRIAECLGSATLRSAAQALLSCSPSDSPKQPRTTKVSRVTPRRKLRDATTSGEAEVSPIARTMSQSEFSQVRIPSPSGVVTRTQASSIS